MTSKGAQLYAKLTSAGSFAPVTSRILHHSPGWLSPVGFLIQRLEATWALIKLGRPNIRIFEQ